MDIQKTMRVLTTVLLAASLLWAWLWAMTFWNRLQILKSRNGYSRATFVVESVEYFYDDSSRPSCWANGVVNGQRERLSLLGTFAKPTSLEQVQSAVPAGTTVEVLYNPSLSRAIVQGETLRVVPFEHGFWEKQERLTIEIGKRMFLPLLLALIAKVVTTIWTRTQNKSMQATPNGAPDG